MATTAGTPAPQLLAQVGARLRRQRTTLQLTQARLAREAGVSPRFLVQLEKGEGNISVARLSDVCSVLGLSLADLFRGLGPGGPEKLALVGLRGAGKSTVGAALALRLDCPFVELAAQVEADLGMSLAEIFELRGEAHYRAAEERVLQATLEVAGPLVVATGGSLVTNPAAWRSLRESARTVWLKAPPDVHLARVMAQGDLRPMRGRPDALGELTEILAERDALYGEADMSIDTDEHGVDGTVDHIVRWIHGH